MDSIRSYPNPSRNSRSDLKYDIPGLEPFSTPNVEGLPPIRSGQNIPLSNDEFFDWVPLAEAHRVKVAQEVNDRWSGRAKARQEQIRLIKADDRYWINTYPAIYESRASEPADLVYETEEEAAGPARAGFLSFILYPFQDYAIQRVKLALRTAGPGGDALIIKSRDMGMTNTMVAMLAYRWMTRPVFQGRLLSRNESLVDATGDTDAMMWKMDLMLQSQGAWLLEHFIPGFDWAAHRRALHLDNPNNFNSLSGESTAATAGRGKRCTAMLLDEFAFMRNFRAIWQATRPASPHRIGVTSVSTLIGMDAYNIVRRGGPTIIILDSRKGLHPRQDARWHELERARDPDGYGQEVGMDWLADSQDQVYPEASDKVVGDFPYVPFAGPTFCTMDDGRYWAIWWLQYIRETGRIRVLEYYQNQGKRTAFYGGMMRGQAVDGFHYGEHEHAILKFTNTTPTTMFMGDTHGAHFESGAGMSVIEELAAEWGIFVNIDYMGRLYIDRQKALENLLPSMDFNDTPRVRDGLSHVQLYAFRPTPPGKEVSREQREPLHNDDSHSATALEFWATQFDDYKHLYTGAQLVATGQDNY